MEMPAQDRQSAERAERAKGLHEAMSDAAQFFTDQLNGIAGAEARTVLENRGVTQETARVFGLGYSPDARGRLREHLKGYGDQTLIEAGLLIKVDEKEPYDRFRGRLMIPIRDPRGRVIAFGGRVIGQGEPKYLNSPDTPLFDKGRTLYNLDRAASASRKTNRVIVVEGYMDVIALDQAGFADSVAPLGTALTEHQLERLWRLTDVPILCFDGDSAGQKAAIRAALRALPGLVPGRSLSFVTLPEGQDPDDLVRSEGAPAFEKLLSQPEELVDRLWKHELAEYLAADRRTPEARTKLGDRLRNHAKQIKDQFVREDYLATFNTLVWDLFHPEKPSKSFSRFGSAPPRRPIAERLHAIALHGIDEVTMVPAVLKGLLRYPALIAPLAETIVRIPINAMRLRQVREVMLASALRNGALETNELEADLRADGHAGVLRQMEAVTLAFSFLTHQGDSEQAKLDLVLAIETLSDGPEFEIGIQQAQAREHEWSADDFENYVKLLRAKSDSERLFQDSLSGYDDRTNDVA